MPITAGTKLGPYEIVSAAGAGGMGEVYKARDTRLDRTVAIKVLPQHLATDAALRERFEREAKAVSSLQHPHICVLHDVGEQDGVDYLVMEYLEGETLADRLLKGPLPAEQTLRYAAEVADGLDRAHRAGIVHRDLKPANIMLTKAGAKILDFGLAKGQASAMGASAMTAMVTGTQNQSKPLTAEGSIVGTFQYMAPETLEGGETDARSDIFSFGAVVYEMVTGRRAFSGKTQASVIAAVLASEPPPISSLVPMTPPALDRVVRTCMAKDPDERFQSAHDVLLQLRWITDAGSQAGVPAPVVAKRQLRKRLLLVVAGLGWAAALGAAVLAVMLSGHLKLKQRPLAAEISSPAGMDFAGALLGAPAISPDETKLAFVAGDAQGPRLWIRDLASGQTVALAGTDGAMFVFWSPDSRAVAFFSGGKLKKMDAAGGPVQILCDAPEGRGGSWSANGIIFTPNILESLYRVPEGGGTPEKITTAKPGWTHRNPYFLPDGERFLFIGRDAAGTSAGSLYAGSLKGGEPTLVLEHASNAQYSGGYLLYLKDGNLVAQGFDLSRLKVRGSPIAVAEKVDYWNARDLAYFAASAGGMLLYRKSVSTSTQATWMDRNGREQGKVGEPGLYLDPQLSVDGSKLALLKVDQTSQNEDVWVVDLKRNNMSRATFAEAANLRYALSPDGNLVAVNTNTSGSHGQIWMQPISGAGTQQALVDSPVWIATTDWSRDGRYLFGQVQENKTREDVFFLDLKGDRKLTKFLQSPASEQSARLSPNGKWLAYQSDESGRMEVYVAAFPGPGSRGQISNGGGTFPQWSHDGKELYFTSGTKLMAAPIPDPASFQFGTPQPLPMPDDLQTYAPGPTADRFLVLKPAGKPEASPVRLVLNWTEALESKK
ncbi:MAG: serine/threonine-protein kinase [Candidatus Koribacter versatilis]|uniref:non-specific serine/threonine protein kinase n=1 Tax=Candidatus Korobacter versatilis TaxID=658062 RepID=A0A932A7S1_9BACT|nr:serine/threonine-protein kinase [Candidatus Koribacter versatilis]